MKRSELFFGAILVPIDFVAMIAAGLLAYYLRVSPTAQEIRPAVFQLDLPLVEYLQLISVVAVVTIVIFAMQGLYVMRATRRPLDELTHIFSSISIGVMIVLVYVFLSAALFQSRFIVMAAYVFAIIFVTAGRFGVRYAQKWLLRRGTGVHRVALIGNGKYGDQLERVFRRKPQLGYVVVGMSEKVRWEEMEELYQRSGLDEVIQTAPTLTDEDNLMLLDFCDKYKIDYKYVPNTFEAHAANVQFRQIGGVPVMELQRTPLDGWGRVAKRLMDLFGVLVGAVILAPIYMAAAVAIRMDSPGPILYSQTRIGRNKKPFDIYKFRSMKQEFCTGNNYGGEKARQYEEKLRQETNERSGPLFKMKMDPRVTRVGRFIRKWRIDELPQLINVARGEMSLFGPRPHLPNEVSRYGKHHQKLFTIKPGMSGMAQVNGNAGLSFDQEANLDIAYVEGWSLFLDIILLFKTLVLLLKDKNAV
ncbi:MAG: sugar transferase [Candidatus Andersenbacteria bacterium]|nr:sugar transferase [bacterium]MDZ4225358.1 sugar transferase [Candidatus Andersenbacteria bacterium]